MKLFLSLTFFLFLTLACPILGQRNNVPPKALRGILPEEDFNLPPEAPVEEERKVQKQQEDDQPNDKRTQKGNVPDVDYDDRPKDKNHNEPSRARPGRQDAKGDGNSRPILTSHQVRPTPDSALEREIEEALAKANGGGAKVDSKPPSGRIPLPDLHNLPPARPRQREERPHETFIQHGIRPPQPEPPRRNFGFPRNNMARGDATAGFVRGDEKEAFKEGKGIPPQFEEKPVRPGERRQFVLKRPGEEKPRYFLRPRYEHDSSDPRNTVFKKPQFPEDNYHGESSRNGLVWPIYRPPVEPPKREHLGLRPRPKESRIGFEHRAETEKSDTSKENRIGVVPETSPFRRSEQARLGYRLVCQRIPLGRPSRVVEGGNQDPNRNTNKFRQRFAARNEARIGSPPSFQDRLARQYTPRQGHLPPAKVNPFLPNLVRVSHERHLSSDAAKARATQVGELSKSSTEKPKPLNPFLPAVKKEEQKKA